jgi:hypothetical protein
MTPVTPASADATGSAGFCAHPAKAASKAAKAIDR